VEFPNLPTPEMTPILTFTLGEQYYALPIEDVVEVAAMVELVNLPNAVPGILGIANRHGEVLPVLDLRLVLGGGNAPIDEWTLFVVVGRENRLIGLVVDAVQQVEYIPAAQIYQSAASGKYIRGIISYRQRLIQLIDLLPLMTTYTAGVLTDNLAEVDA